YQTGVYGPYPTTNSAGGVIFSMEGQLLPGWGTDAAGLPFAPLMVHQDEMIAAAAGDLDAIKHAVRFTLDSLSIPSGDLMWPAQSVTSGAYCQGPGSGFVWTINGNGTATVTGSGFRPTWPAGMTIAIDSVNYKIVSVASSGQSMVVSSPVPAG